MSMVLTLNELFSQIPVRFSLDSSATSTKGPVLQIYSDYVSTQSHFPTIFYRPHRTWYETCSLLSDNRDHNFWETLSYRALPLITATHSVANIEFASLHAASALYINCLVFDM